MHWIRIGDTTLNLDCVSAWHKQLNERSEPCIVIHGVEFGLTLFCDLDDWERELTKVCVVNRQPKPKL